MIHSITAFIFGLFFGSFANVCIWRIPRKVSVVRPPSHCPYCLENIPWYYNIPLLGYVFLRGRCHKCQSGISLRYPAVELITAVITASWFFRFDMSFTPFIFVFFGIVLVIISGIDTDYKIISPGLSYTLMITGIAVSPLNGFISSRYFYGIAHSVLALAAGGLVIILIRLLGNMIFRKESMGLGDAKLMMGIGAFTGLKGVFLTLFIASFAAAVSGVIEIVIRRKKPGYIPFGPYLSLGAVLYVLFSGYINKLLLF